MSKARLTEPLVSAAHQRALLDVAACAIRDTLTTGRIHVPDIREFSPVLHEPGATFVTLERDADLLGCIGALEATRPLVADVAHNAVAAAFADPRVPPITADDYVHMSIKISVLSAPEQIDAASYDELTAVVRPHVDGIVLESGRARSTLLPAVWPKVRDVHEFLDVVWRKAGLTPGTWPRGTRVSRYTTEEFCDPGPR